MWFSFLALGATYYALPKLLNRPIYSYALGVLGFWTNLAFYPVIGAHHFEFSPLPWWLQTLAIVFSVGMLVPVWAGSGNFLLTMRGRWESVRRSIALPYLFVGVMYYLLGSTQGTFEALRTAQAYWHFTNYTVGHSHATMYGFITFIAWGAVYAVLPRATGKNPSRLAAGVHFWLALLGVTFYVLSLSVAGTLQGMAWVAGRSVHQIRGVGAAVLGWSSRRRDDDVCRACRLRIQRVPHDLGEPATRGRQTPSGLAGAGMKSLPRLAVLAGRRVSRAGDLHGGSPRIRALGRPRKSGFASAHGGTSRGS